MTFDLVIEVAIEPKTKSDQEKLSLSIQKLAEERIQPSCAPGFRRPARPSSAAYELHLDISGDLRAGIQGRG